VRRRTIEWQVCGTCNYDCSYCIQSKRSRQGHPSEPDVERFLRFFAGLPGTWEIKMSGGEPFAFKAFVGTIVPGLVERSTHDLSVLTNLSAPFSVLDRFADLTCGRLRIVSASLHLEFTSAREFAEKAVRLASRIGDASLVCNVVLVPGRLEEVARAKATLEGAGLRFFPQLMKTKHATVDYDEGDRRRLLPLLGERPTPRTANLAPSYRGRRCWSGVDYFVLSQTGEAFRCRTAKRFGEGRLGNVLEGDVRLWDAPEICSYEICPCTVPANRGMIEELA
jgi:MoaA/NifB/PqqE/SkfB family radical SAM enzyme